MIRVLPSLTVLGMLAVSVATAQDRGSQQNPPPEGRGQNQQRPQNPDGQNADPRSPSGDQLMESWNRPATRWHKSTDLIGKKVKNTAGEDLGEIGDLAIDPEKGRVIYGVLQFGGFMGLGEKWFAIPWSALRLSPDSKYVTLSVDKAQLEASRGFDKSGQWPNFGDSHWAEETYRHYGQPAYWAADAKEDMYKPTARWQKATDLVGKDVKNGANEDIGDLENLVIDPDNGRVLYGVVDFESWMEGDDLAAIPWKALTLTNDYAHFVLNMDKEALKRSPRFRDGAWPNLTDERWGREVHVFYGAPVYWDPARDRTPANNQRN